MTESQLNSLLEAHIKEHLSPTPAERVVIDGRYDRLQSFLKGQCFRTGSYARYTSKRPVNDLDVIWRLPDSFLAKDEFRKMIEPSQLSPTQLLSDLARHLGEEYRRANIPVRIKAQTHSVGIYFGATDEEFSIDLVPAVATGEKNEYDDDIFWVPEIIALSKSRRASEYASGRQIRWIKSDPKGYIEDARALNEDNPAFRKVAKFVRKWRSGCREKNPKLSIKSFHLELIVSDIFKEQSDVTTTEAVRRFFQKLDKYFVRPSFVDRAHEQQYVDAYVSQMTEQERNDVRAHAHCAVALFARLPSAATSAEVTAIIKDVLMGEKMHYLPAQTSPVSLLPLGDFSHKQELHAAGIYDQGEPYPCTVTLRADLYFKGPRDRKINTRRQRSVTSDTLIPVWHEIKFQIRTNAPEPYEVYWQVVNTGAHATAVDNLRGTIEKGTSVHMESSQYTGKHWIEAFIVHRGRCIARSGRFYVNFINPSYPLLPSPQASVLSRLRG